VFGTVTSNTAARCQFFQRPHKILGTETFRQINIAESLLRSWPFLTPAINFLPFIADLLFS
jgi:hypothetical protein